MESDDTDNVISKKSRRKLDKKENKYKHFISQLPGIQHSSEPTKFLMICNAGLVNGFDEGQAVQIFSKYGLLVSVSMLPGKSFCFVTFSETAGAQNTYNNLNGKMKLPKMLGPIYMIYTTAAPSSKMECLGKRPNGIFLLEKFITEDEERKLVNSISFNETTHSGNPTLLKNRRVKHYGYEFQYSNNNVNREEKLPEDLPNECNILKQKLDNHGWGHLRWPADQLTVNEYQPGQGIPPHIDTHSAFESPIMSLSLLSDIVMEFRHADGSHFPLHLPRRSLLIMDEEARYDWTHAIRPRKMDVIYGSGPVVVERGVRISFTFRWLREGGCKCIYRDQCDSQATKASSTLDCDASRLESQHVHQVYNKISSHFSQTRYRAWPNVAEFVASLPSGSVLFDVGCGNGKYFGLHRNIFEMGGDRSDGLLEECSRRGFEGVQCDCLQLPLRSESVDGLICIAVIHHLSTHERRVDAIREMARVLRQGGRGLVYVWAKDQQRNNIPSKYLKQEGGLKNKAGEEDARNKGDCDRRGKKCSKTKLDHRERVNISRCDKRCEEKNVELVREDVERIRISENKCLEPKLGRDVENCYVNSERETWKTKLDHGKARNVGSCDAENRERKCLEPKLGRDVENCCVNSETETWKTKLDHGKASCIEKSEGVKGLALDQEDDENIGICNEVTSVRRGLERELNERKVAQVSAEENVENMSSCKNRGRETTKLDEVNRKNREMESTCNSDQDVVLTNVSGCNTESRDGISLNHESSLSNISGSYTEIKYSMSFNRESSQEIVKGFSCNDREKSVNQHKININSCENIENVSKTSENNELCSPESEFLLPVHNNRTQFKHDDILVPWTFKTETFYRYYHVFKEGELEDLCSFVSEIQVEKIYYDQGNWCVIFEKCGK